MPNYGVSYVVIAVGSKDEPATPDDLAMVREAVAPFTGTVLSDRVADTLTVALLREAGAL